MTTRIFFDNQTKYNYELIDIDKFEYGVIQSSTRFYTFILPYYGVSPSNSNPMRPFKLKSKSDSNVYIIMYLNSIGQIMDYKISPAATELNINCAITGSMNIGYPFSQPLNDIVTNIGGNTSVTPVPISLPETIYNTFIIYTGTIFLNNNNNTNPNICSVPSYTYY
jgi:hypothetical protein